MANEKRLIYSYNAENAVSAVLRDSTLGPAARGVLIKAIQNIENVPTVDAVEVVHGRWEDFADKHDKSAKRHDFRCSVCNNRASKFVGGTEDWWDMWKPNYCPNCGAKMDGGAGNE